MHAQSGRPRQFSFSLLRRPCSSWARSSAQTHPFFSFAILKKTWLLPLPPVGEVSSHISRHSAIRQSAIKFQTPMGLQPSQLRVSTGMKSRKSRTRDGSDSIASYSSCDPKKLCPVSLLHAEPSQVTSFREIM